MLKKSFSIFLLVLISLPVFAQRNVTIHPKVYDFGEIIGWWNPEAKIAITNTGKKPLQLFSEGYAMQYRVRLPFEAIAPGETDTIYLQYYTSNKGFFRQNINVKSNQHPNGISIGIKGKIKSFAPEALMECPTQNNTEEDPRSFQMNAEIVDTFTKQAIPNAQITLLGSSNIRYETRSNENGKIQEKLPLQLYEIEISAKGYYSKSDFRYLNRNNNQLYYELKPIVKEELPVLVQIEDIPNKSISEKITDNSVLSDSLVAERELEGDEPEAYAPKIKGSTKLSEGAHKPNNIVFLIDVSVSMNDVNKLPLLQESMKNLVLGLRNIDKVAILSYSGKVYEVLPSTRASESKLIFESIDNLKIKSITDGVTGLSVAYETALLNYIPDGNNEVILATDGLFNSPNYKESKLYKLIRRYNKIGIGLSVVGFGEDPEAEKLMYKLARLGDGSYLSIRDRIQAQNILLEAVKSRSLIQLNE